LNSLAIPHQGNSNGKERDVRKWWGKEFERLDIGGREPNHDKPTIHEWKLIALRKIQ